LGEPDAGSAGNCAHGEWSALRATSPQSESAPKDAHARSRNAATRENCAAPQHEVASGEGQRSR